MTYKGSIPNKHSTENGDSTEKPDTANLQTPERQGGEGGEGGASPSATASTGGVEGGKGGEGGEVTPPPVGEAAPASSPFTPFSPSALAGSVSVSNAEFIAGLFQNVQEGAAPLIVAKPGDPQQGGWQPQLAERVESVCRKDTNNYVNSSSFKMGGDGLPAAKKELVAAYHFLVLDDVGTKVDLALLGGARPSYVVETSPGNYQVGFRFSPPLTDLGEVEQLQQTIAAARLTDAGALGAARWARLPNAINGKPKYDEHGSPFKTVLRHWAPEVGYTPADLLAELGLSPSDRNHAAKPTARKPSRNGLRPAINPEVYTPKADENPALTTLKAAGLYKKELAPGKHDVTCPWRDEHTDGLDDGAAYFEPSPSHPAGGFVCQHSHRDKYRLAQVLAHLELTNEMARNRPMVRLVPGEMKSITMASEHVLSQVGNIYQSGGLIVRARTDVHTGDIQLVPLTESAVALELSEHADFFKPDGKSEAYVRTDPPVRHVSNLYKAQEFNFLPDVQGIARQPYHDKQTGALITTPGYNAASQRLGVFDAAKYPPIAASREAAVDALSGLMELVKEFHFASPEDRAVALSAMVTAATRPSLGLAPAFHICAPSSGTGKSYLAEVITSFASPGQPLRMSYPKTSEEATKVVLAALLGAPAVIEFDDMDTDWIPHGVINRMLTSSSITDRILGMSKVATVQTSVLVLGSGNNVTPLRDLARRVITINLNARTAAPGQLTYVGDPVGEVKANREKYVAKVLTIVEAWKAAGSPRAPVPSIASYNGLWADYCRHALIWLGLEDPVAPLHKQMLTDPDADVLERLLVEWHLTFGDQPVTLRNLLKAASDTDFRDTLLDLPVVDRGEINRTRLGYYFKRNANRIVGEHMLEKAPSSERNAWRVVKVGPVTPPLPPFPPSAQPADVDAADVSF